MANRWWTAGPLEQSGSRRHGGGHWWAWHEAGALCGVERFDMLPLLVATDGAIAACGHDSCNHLLTMRLIGASI